MALGSWYSSQVILELAGNSFFGIRPNFRIASIGAFIEFPVLVVPDFIAVNLSDKQQELLKQMQSTCRWLYNEYIETNKLLYQMYQLGCSNIKFMSGYDFSKYVNNTLSKQPNMQWIKDCGSKSRKQAIMNAEKAFKNFFNGKGFPKLKKKKDMVGIYLPNNSKTDFKIYRYKIKIPIFGDILLKEFGYITTKSKIKSCTITQIANKYFISILTEDGFEFEENKINKEGIGIDLGVKELAVCSNGKFYKNINKTEQVKKLNNKLKRKQRALIRKFKKLKTKKEKLPRKKNIDKNILSIQKIYSKLSRIRMEYIRFVVNDIIKQEPSFITIENLNIKGMMKNRHLSKAIAEQCLYSFKIFLTQQCKKYNIELRIVDRFYPSSKLCNCCGQIKSDLKLSDRIYVCDCGYAEDRDINASKNLRDAITYKIV
jgi:putative transposase